MANYIKNLKEDNNDVTYPVTKAGAVYLNSGIDLESKVGTLVSAEEIAATSPSTPLVGTNMISDKAVTADKIDWTTMSVVEPFIVSTPLPSEKAITASAITEIQTISLPAGKWFITSMIRGYYSSTSTSIVYGYIYTGSSQTYSIAINAASDGSTARFQVCCGLLVQPSSTTTYTSRIQAPAAANISTSSYLYAMRIG